MAWESIKDPYRFDFLGLTDEAQERDIEHALVRHVTEFLLELGAGFAFVGRQVLLDVGGDEFFIDLLFYHLKLRCYVVIELKGGKFKPEHLGQLGFYLTAVDRQVKSDHDNATIGLLLCKSKNKVVAEYALGDKSQPMGVANTSCWSRCQRSSEQACRASSKSSANWAAPWIPITLVTQPRTTKIIEPPRKFLSLYVDQQGRCTERGVKEA